MACCCKERGQAVLHHWAKLVQPRHGRHIGAVVHHGIRCEQGQNLARVSPVEMKAIRVNDIGDVRFVEKALQASFMVHLNAPQSQLCLCKQTIGNCHSP